MFECCSSAKYILSGEHSVLRGHPALVFPVNEKLIKLCYDANNSKLSVSFAGEFEKPMILVFWGLLEESLQKVGKSKEDLYGNVVIKNEIPLGVGLGFSAAFCVVITKLFIYLGWLDDGELFSFATGLEDYFHGKSSGLDVLGSSSTSGMFFLDKKNYSALSISWKPKLYLMYSGRVSVTSQCVKKVVMLNEENPEWAQEIDKRMSASVLQAYHSLKEPNDLKGLSWSIKTAQQCFHDWGLVPEDVANKVAYMYQNGAIAVKITGAGDGGFLLGLWLDEPPKKLDKLLIEL